MAVLSALLFPLLLAHQGPRPAWVGALPEVPGRVYALGTAELGNPEGRAIARASDRARLEVVARLRATIQGRTRVATRTVEMKDGAGRGAGAGERITRDEVSVGARAEDLPGLTVEQTFTDAEARTVFALAYLDLRQAATSLASRLDRLRQDRLRVGPETSRRALWRLRKAASDLDRLEEILAFLPAAGPGRDLVSEAAAERRALEARLEALGRAELPPLDLSRLTLALRANVDLPLGVDAYLRSLASSHGLRCRELDPDLVLDLAFAPGPEGPAFIFATLDVYSGVTYHLEAKVTLLEGGGAALTRAAPLTVVQGETPEGMMNQFRRQIDRLLPRLLDEFKAGWN
ncbi:MAG TPA: hypothetical protein VK188_14875 [Holophaga sp.]|nr:hypothetical protein [Holophaga sp.]